MCYLTHSFETKYPETRSSIGLVSGGGSLDLFQHGNDLTTGVFVACLLWTNHRLGHKLQDGQAHFSSFYKNQLGSCKNHLTAFRGRDFKCLR